MPESLAQLAFADNTILAIRWGNRVRRSHVDEFIHLIVSLLPCRREDILGDERLHVFHEGVPEGPERRPSDEVV